MEGKHVQHTALALGHWALFLEVVGYEEFFASSLGIPLREKHIGQSIRAFHRFRFLAHVLVLS